MKNLQTFEEFINESLIQENIAAHSPKSAESLEDAMKDKPEAFDHICKLFDFASRSKSKDPKEIEKVIKVDKLSKKEDPKLGQAYDAIHKKFRPIGISLIDLIDIAYYPTLKVVRTGTGREKVYYFTNDSNF